MNSDLHVELQRIINKEPLTESQPNVARFFQKGLENFLDILVGLYAAGILRAEQPPPGFTARFRRNMLNPVLGSLLELLNWMAGQRVDPSLNQLSTQMQYGGSGISAWIKKMIQLRNRWIHPEGESPESVLAEAIPVLMAPPDLSALGVFTQDPHARLIWVGEGKVLELAPFVGIHDGEIVAFSGFRDPDQLIFPSEIEFADSKFQAIWREARLRDPVLEDPTPDEIHFRANRIIKITPYAGQPVDWMPYVLERGPMGFIVNPETAPGLLAGLTSEPKQAVVVDLALNPEKSIAVSFAESLGLAKPPTISEFAVFGNTDRPLVILSHADNLDSRSFLRILLWLADLRDNGDFGGLRVLVSRGQDQLKQDNEKLWDRLPERLDEILRKPPRGKGNGLESFLWPQILSKGLLGMFKL